MSRPKPTWLYHFTHLNHLASITTDGLLSDGHAVEQGRITTEIGQPGIKEQRRYRRVPCGPGGVVSDYAPFYYAPRSPMLYAIIHGRVASYTEGQEQLVYLVTTVERVIELGVTPIFTDRNAVLAITRFTSDPADLDDLVDWPLMAIKMWNNTPDDPDRRERRMAECLVHRQVPWEAFMEVLTIDQEHRQRAETILASVGHSIQVRTHPRAYF
ncbi:MAG: DUF4433 domain-containing protein [Candidatus Dormibacteraeota bacterium]|jgi:hypothetical protein|nr:DUF4433 domain-containing protein [Candidatus Dormibacteraeota bacterium]